MPKTNRKIRRQRRKKFRVVLVILVMIYLLFRVIPGLYAQKSKGYIVNSGFIEVIENTKAIVLKDEKVYYAKSPGILNLLRVEGEKVGVDAKIATIIIDDSDGINNQIKIIDEKIKVLKEENIAIKFFSEDVSKNQKVLDSTVLDIQSSINNNDFKDVTILKKELLEKLKLKNTMSGETPYIKNSIEDLYEEKQQLLIKLDKVSYDYFSKEAGLISLNIDGLENVYNIKSISKLDIDDLNFMEGNNYNISNSDQVDLGQPIFKICRNNSWYIITKIDNEGILNIKEGKNLYVRFNKNNEKLRGKIVKIENENSETVVVIKFDSHLYEYLNDRYVDIEIIKDIVKGLKIPNSSISKRDGIVGVYIKNINDIVSFRPIKIIDKDEEYTIIEEGTNGIIEINDNSEITRVRSVMRYDEIILNWSKIRSYNIIN